MPTKWWSHKTSFSMNNQSLPDSLKNPWISLKSSGMVNWSTGTLKTSLELEIHGTQTTPIQNPPITHQVTHQHLPPTTMKMFCTNIDQIFLSQIHFHHRHNLTLSHINNDILNWKCLVTSQLSKFHNSGDYLHNINRYQILFQIQVLILILSSPTLSLRLTSRLCRMKLLDLLRLLMLLQHQSVHMAATTPKLMKRQCKNQMPLCGMRLQQKNSTPFGIWELLQLLNYYHLEPRQLTQS